MSVGLTDPSVAERLEFLRRTVLSNPWIPQNVREGLTPKQAEFLVLPCREALFGGAARGGKTHGGLMTCMQFAQTPGYSAIIFRKTFADLAQPGCIIPTLHEWLDSTPARYDKQNHVWHIPTGKGSLDATIQLGYMDTEDDHYRYQGTVYQTIDWDELTQNREEQYRYMFSRLVRLTGSEIPLRVRAQTNPGGRFHEWVKRRFLIEGPDFGRVFVPSKLTDNPHVDQAAYVASLGELPEITRRQLLDGDWDVVESGGRFKREWFGFCDQFPPVPRSEWVRYWDLAATEASTRNRDPDWTVGALVCWYQGKLYVLDVKRVRATPTDVGNLIKRTAYEDGQDVRIYMEQEPGSSGVTVIDAYKRGLMGFAFEGDKATGNKHVRIRVLQAATQPIGSAQQGNVVLYRAPWNGPLLDEADAYQGDDRTHDDQLDAITGAMSKAAKYDGHPTTITHGLFAR